MQQRRAALRRRTIGYVFQRLNLVPGLTAVENVMLPLELDGVGGRKARTKARRRARRSRPRPTARSLSRRLLRRSAATHRHRARIVGTRRLLLADEPTGSLDKRDRRCGHRAHREPAGANTGHRSRARHPRATLRGLGRSRRVHAGRAHRRCDRTGDSGRGRCAVSRGFRLATRLARREVVRRPGRTMLVALLVAVPVMCMAVAAVPVRTDDLTALQDFRLHFGDRADITVSDLRPLTPDVLPPGARGPVLGELAADPHGRRRTGPRHSPTSRCTIRSPRESCTSSTVACPRRR